MVKLLLDSLSDVCDFLQDVLHRQHNFLHHMYLIHQTLFSGFLKKKTKNAQTLMRYTVCQLLGRVDKEQFISAVLLCVIYLLNGP